MVVLCVSSTYSALNDACFVCESVMLVLSNDINDDAKDDLIYVHRMNDIDAHEELHLVLGDFILYRCIYNDVSSLNFFSFLSFKFR